MSESKGHMNANKPGSGPLKNQVADTLRRAIHDGTYTPGSTLPTEQELAEKHNVSRQTVRAAVDILTREGLITSGRGRGRRVRETQRLTWHLTRFESQSHRADGHDGLDAWSAEVKAQGRRPREQVSVIIDVSPPKFVIDKLSLEPGAYVVRRQRLRHADELPCQISTSYFPEEIARGTLLMENRSVSAPGGILASSGFKQTRYVDEINCRMPTPEEKQELELLEGTPVIEHIRTGYDNKGRPLRVMTTVAPGDRQTLIYEVNAE